jgi:hypothetical protein
LTAASGETKRLEWRAWPAWRPWLFALVPLLGVIELVLHVKQSHGAPSDADWTLARDAVRATQQPGDLVVFAPSWVDPLGRKWLGPELASVAREARADEARFPRALEVSIRGQHAPELRAWKKTSERKMGAITLAVLENPSPVRVLDDLLAHEGPERMRVVRTEGDRFQECSFTKGAVQTGNLGFGPAIPGTKFQCAGGTFVGITVMPVLDYSARRCIYASPPGGAAAIRIEWKQVQLGSVLHGHHGLYVEAERAREGAPVTLAFRIGDKSIGRVVHVDGDGWKPFELPTGEWVGQKADLVAEISAPSGSRRMYCFEAVTW